MTGTQAPGPEQKGILPFMDQVRPPGVARLSLPVWGRTYQAAPAASGLSSRLSFPESAHARLARPSP